MVRKLLRLNGVKLPNFTKIVNGEKEEFQLCEKCAQEKGDMYLINNTSGFSLNNLLAGLFNIEPNFQQSQQDAFEKQEILQCENCSMTFNQFIKVGQVWMFSLLYYI